MCRPLIGAAEFRNPPPARLAGAPICGLKIIAASGWFVAQPSGTEDIYKIYAESCRDERHLRAIVDEAQQIVSKALSGGA